MSAIISQDPPETNFFIKKLENPAVLAQQHSETVRRVQQDIEKRLGPRKAKTQLDLLEIQQVAEIVDELLERKKAMTTAPQPESRVAPAPEINLSTTRRQAYEQRLPPLPLPSPSGEAHHHHHRKRSGSEAMNRGIYTLPSSDPEGNHIPELPLELNNHTTQTQMSAKIVSNLLAAIQVVLILIFAVFIHYDDTNAASISRAYIESKKPTERPSYDSNFYNPNNFRGPPPPPPPVYNSESEGSEGPYMQPVTTPLQPAQNLHQFYYCKLSRC